MKQLSKLLIITLAITSLAYSQKRISPTTSNATEIENSVQGSLTYNGKTVNLQYAYAKSGSVDNNPGIHLFFTERPVVQNMIQDDFQKWAKSGEINGIYVRVDAKTRQAVAYEVAVNKAYWQVYNYDYLRSQSDGFSGEVFKLTSPDSALMQGTISAKRSDKNRGYDYQFQLTFKAQIKKDAWTGNFGVYPPVTVALGRAEGEMTYLGKSKKLNYVYADERVNLSNSDDRTIHLIFTEKAATQGQPGNEHKPYLELRINPKTNKVVGADIMRTDGNDSSASTSMTSAFVISKDGIIEGRFAYEGSYKLSCKARIEADPNTPITAANGKAIAIGGGEPGKAFLQFMDSLQQAKSIEEIVPIEKRSRAAVILRGRNQSTDQELKSATAKEKELAFELYKLAFIVADAKITGGFIANDKATLAVVGVQDKREVKGSVNMYLENGQWKVGKQELEMTGKFVRPKKPAVTSSAKTAPANVPASAKANPPAMANTSGTVTGTFLLDGKPVGLKYVYAQRRLASRHLKLMGIELLITDKPVPEKLLKEINAAEYRLYYLMEDYFKDTSIKGLFYWIPESGASNEAGYFLTVIGPESYAIESKNFSSFVMQKGRLQAKAADKGELGEVKWNYALDISVTDASVARKNVGVLPEAGKASGSMHVKGATTDLKYAYAIETLDGVTVLITSEAITKTTRPLADKSLFDGIVGLYLRFSDSGELYSFEVKYNLGMQSGGIEDFAVNECRLENGRLIGKVKYPKDGAKSEKSFSVSFDAPLKK
jgi:hypothetical protein